MIRILLTGAAAILLAACGGNTSVYFCSGSDEFCDRTRQLGGDATADGAATSDAAADASANALDVARQTPVLIEQGLAADSLEKTLDASPDLVGGWLLAASLGLLVDDSDNAAASRFFDQNRYWLTGADAVSADSQVLEAGMLLLADVAETRDPAVAEYVSALLEGSALVWEAPAPDIGVTARGTMAAGVTEACCSAAVLAAASVVLCDDLGPQNGSSRNPSVTGEACAVARGWLSELTR